MSGQGASKLLVIGAVECGFAKFAKKVAPLHKKHGPFDACLVSGDFFAAEENRTEEAVADLLAGKFEFPLPVYITYFTAELPEAVSDRAALNDGEICANLIFLGQYGTCSLSSGVKLAFVAGTGSPNPFLATLRKQKSAQSGCDVLLGHEWPERIDQLSAAPLPPNGDQSYSRELAELLKAIKPRYHFAASGSNFWEREPYRFATGGNPCRFLSLGAVGNAEGKRWFYAMNVVPMARLDPAGLALEPPNTTGYPLDQPKRAHDAGDGEARVPPPGYMCKICHTAGHFIDDCPDNSRYADTGNKAKRAMAAPSNCWFCLSNPKVEKHLVVSIGKEAYLTLARGTLRPEYGSHLLIMPINHMGVATGVVRTEMEAYVRAVKQFFKSRGWVAIGWESTWKALHLSHQMVGVLPEHAEAVRKEFRQKLPQLQPAAEGGADTAPPKSPYFRLDLPNEPKPLFASIDVKVGLPATLPRDCVLRGIGGSEKRLDWKLCVREPAEERVERKETKKAFKVFDFTLDEPQEKVEDE